MKRMLGTVVLFILLILTVFALTQIHARNTSAFNAKGGMASYADN